MKINNGRPEMETLKNEFHEESLDMECPYGFEEPDWMLDWIIEKPGQVKALLLETDETQTAEKIETGPDDLELEALDWFDEMPDRVRELLLGTYDPLTEGGIEIELSVSDADLIIDWLERMPYWIKAELRETNERLQQKSMESFSDNFFIKIP